MTDLSTLAPGALLTHARALFAPRAHWTALAAIVGRVEDEGLAVAFGYPSARAWAVSECHLTSAGYVELAKLHDAMVAAGHPELWAAVPKARALQVLPILALGGDAAAWLMRAANATGEEWAGALKKAPAGAWDRWVIAWPRDCVATRKAALERIAEGLGIPAERIHDREVEHKLLLPLLEAVLGATGEQMEAGI